MADDDSALLDLLGEDNIVQAINDWAQGNAEDFLAVIGGQFDQGGVQEATSASATGVKKVMLYHGKLLAVVHFSVTYNNPIDSEDTDMSAENVTDDTFTISLDAIVNGIELEDFGDAPDGVFP